MKLRTKLLLGVGILLFAMAIVMYSLPAFFVRNDVYQAADQIHDLLIADHHELVRSQQVWLENALATIKENTNAILYLLYEEPSLKARLTFGGENTDQSVWNALAEVVGYDPNIGFAQAHSPKEGKVAAISPNAASLHPINQLTMHNNFVYLSLIDPKQQFLGIPLPDELQNEEGYTLYELISPKESSKRLQQTEHRIRDLLRSTLHNPPFKADLPTIELDERNEHILHWNIKTKMIRALTPLYADALSQHEEFARPLGLARVDQSGNGYALLTKEVYSTQPLFDDERYYKENLPEKAKPPIAYGSAVVTVPKGDFAYIGNTVLLDSTYFTIGTPLGYLARQLALSSNKMIFMKISQDFWLGFDAQGHKLSQKIVEEVVNNQAFDQKNGIITIGSNTYYFASISSLENNLLAFLAFHPMEGEQTIVSTLLSLEDRLTDRISWQLALISLGTMVLVLIFIGRIGFTVIYPVTKLAAATQDIVAGRYEEVELPDVGHRKDEVATLTRSFADMVKGLQEREKIRGVLDKVVSKDVADEILRTQIHLGGEDRVVSMLFSDIRGFTHLTAHMPPQKTIQLLNICMTKVSRVIEGEGGVIDKYVGDEVMAIYGAPTTHPDHALRAVSSAMLILETLKKWNQHRINAGEPVIEMGIGVHTGLVVAGNMGAEDRLNYTVLGANVNLAARLCESAKANQLLISEATLAEPNIRESFYTVPLPPISLKGFADPVPIYEITGFKWDNP